MSFSTTSFFAGVGTVFAAVALGFAGGAMITTAPKVEPNRLERLASTAPAMTPDAGVKTVAPDVRSVAAAKTPEDQTAATKIERQSPPASDAVMTPASVPQQAVPPQPAPVIARPVMASSDADAQADSAKKARDDELKKVVAAKNAERRADRRRERRRRDIEAAENAVLQMRRDDGPQVLSQRYDNGPRMGFFGDE